MKPFLDRFESNEGESQPGIEPAAPEASRVENDHTAGQESAGREEELVLTLGDFLHRIPAHLLKPGQHDVGEEIRFPLKDIANWIAERVTSIPLALIYQKVPGIFEGELQEADQLEVRFPWQKVLFLINETAANAPPDSLAAKLKSGRTVEFAPPAGGSASSEGAQKSHSTPSPQPPQPGGDTWFSRARLGMHAQRSCTSVGAPGGASRTQAEYQRTITELNRRILALEGTQKERAQDLAKEKEGRLRAERRLAALERSLQESATLIENTRAEGKRELESEIRKREAEHARVRKEQQNQITLLKEEIRQMQIEREELRAKVESRSETSAQAAAAWESRTVTQLEADLLTCRDRLKRLLGERDTLSREKLALLRRIEELQKG